MRHDLLLALALAVASRSPCMREAPGTPALIAPAGFAQRLAPRRTGALTPAVALAAVAAAAYQHRRTAACTDKCPRVALRLTLTCTTHARLAALRAHSAGGLSTWTTTCAAAILRAHSRSTRVGRGGSNNLPVVAVTAPVLWAQFYSVFNRRRHRYGNRGAGGAAPSTSPRPSLQPAAAMHAALRRCSREPDLRRAPPVHARLLGLVPSAQGLGQFQ